MKEIDKALERLYKSTTQLTRRNARRALKNALDRIWRDADSQYPGMNKDGTERIRATKPRCPVCGIPGKTWIAIAKHAVAKHERWKMVTRAHPITGTNRTLQEMTCWCGKTFASQRMFARHLQAMALKDELSGHPAIEALQNL